MSGIDFISENKGVLVVAVFTAVMISLISTIPQVEASEPFLAEIKWVGFNFAPRGFAFCDGQELPISQNQSLFSLLGFTYGGDDMTLFALPDMRGRSPIHVGNGIALGERGGSETVTLTTQQMPSHTHAFDNSQGKITLSAKLHATNSAGDTINPTDVDTTVATNNLNQLITSLGKISGPDKTAINDAVNSALSKLPSDPFGALQDLLGVKDNVTNLADGAVTNAYNTAVDSLNGNSLGVSFARTYSTQTPNTAMHAGSITVSGSTTNTGSDQGHENRPPQLGINCIIALQGLFPSRN